MSLHAEQPSWGDYILLRNKIRDLQSQDGNQVNFWQELTFTELMVQEWKQQKRGKNRQSFFFFFLSFIFHVIFFFCLFVFFRATPTALGWIRAVVAGLNHGTATQDPSHVYDLHHSSWQHRILNPPSKARDRTRNLIVPSRIRFRCATVGTLPVCFLYTFQRRNYLWPKISGEISTNWTV